ncbi:hypothetical protein [Hyphomonas sp. BRH_c22]|uniref:hypothetical protein n=1 Tax=Hyphomonas sp. BRH_c22 TaxID=1629710 RepID=UPI00260A2306|nr:hypothetical protein [Hyphomonas sp. BRH_c22]
MAADFGDGLGVGGCGFVPGPMGFGGALALLGVVLVGLGERAAGVVGVAGYSDAH